MKMSSALRVRIRLCPTSCAVSQPTSLLPSPRQLVFEVYPLFLFFRSRPLHHAFRLLHRHARASLEGHPRIRRTKQPPRVGRVHVQR